jgi:hypothetical protein
MLFMAQTKTGMALKCSTLGMALALVYVSGAVSFVVGLTFYSAASFFAKEFVNVQSTLDNASILYQSPTYPIGRVMVLLSAVGAIYAAYREGTPQRNFALLHVTMTTLLVGGGTVIIVFFPQWRGPQGQYFELGLWPSYVSYSVYTLVTAINACRPYFTIKQPITGKYKCPPFLSWPVKAAVNHPVFLVPVTAILINCFGHAESSRASYPPSRTPIIEILRSEIGLKENSDFRGYAATFTSLGSEDKGIGWLEQHAFDQLTLVQKFNNDHRFIGLWHYKIPTLNEYNQYTTPPLYLFASRLLARPFDLQVRNVITYTAPDLNLLQGLGVRYIITDKQLSDDALLRERLEYSENRHIYLYELPKPNVGTYSPVDIHLLTTAGEIIERIKRGTRLNSEVLLTHPVQEPLVPATKSRMVVIRNGVRLVAESSATSLIVLPVQFTRCLQPMFNGTKPENFGIYRANLVQTAVVFSGRLDMSLSMSIGPFGNSECRLGDIADMYDLRLHEATEMFPLGISSVR